MNKAEQRSNQRMDCDPRRKAGETALAERPENTGNTPPPFPEHDAIEQRRKMCNGAAFTGSRQRENGRQGKDYDLSIERESPIRSIPAEGPHWTRRGRRFGSR